MIRRVLLLAVMSFCFVALSGANDAKVAAPPRSAPSAYLFVWAEDATRQSTDFLAVLDANPASSNYGRVVASVPVAATATMPHHTEYEFPPDNRLFAIGWATGRSFIFDLREPTKPRLAGQYDHRAGYAFPHSFARLPNGNLLGTFQSRGDAYGPGGGLVELDSSGTALRSSSAVDPAVNKEVIWPYSLAIVPALDRVVSSSTPMGLPHWATPPPGSWAFKKVDEQLTQQVQIWRLSDLHLLKTINLPPGAQGKHNNLPAEPRLLPDGSVYVNTFTCGLYRINDVAGRRPSAELVYTFPGGEDMHTMCSVPVIVGHYWIQTVGALPGLIALDISHPEKPVEVSRLKLDARFPMPHWMAADRNSDRLVITGDEQSWLLVARFDRAKGTLSLDPAFREPGAHAPGVSFDRKEWPHGAGGRALVHGALFGPR
jgi:hypothetical protein